MPQTTPLITAQDWSDNLPWIDLPNPNIKAYVASLPNKPNYNLQQKLEDWHNNGLVIFKREVHHDLIDLMLADIMHLREHFSDYDIGIRIRKLQTRTNLLETFPDDLGNIKLNHLHCFSRAAAHISLSRNIQDFLGHVFQSPAAVLQSLTFWRGSQQPTHIDYPYVNQQKKLPYMAASWTALEDIRPGSGPLGYFPGGHKSDKSGFYDWGNGSITLDERSTGTPLDFADYLDGQMAKAKIKIKSFFPKKGDVLIWHANLPHRGMSITNPDLTRKSYVTHFTANALAPDWLKNESYADGPVGVFENGGYAYVEPSMYNSKRLPSWDMDMPIAPPESWTDKLVRKLRH